jgi:hypothetical protein
MMKGTFWDIPLRRLGVERQLSGAHRGNVGLQQKKKKNIVYTII